MKRREKEPSTSCPICREEIRLSDLRENVPTDDGFRAMCSRCCEYLGPGQNGQDFLDTFMARTDTNGPRNRRRAYLRPRGFWSDVINVYEDVDYFASLEAKVTVYKYRVTWGCGGEDGTRSSIECAQNFAKALDHAIALAKAWELQDPKPNPETERS